METLVEKANMENAIIEQEELEKEKRWRLPN